MTVAAPTPGRPLALLAGYYFLTFAALGGLFPYLPLLLADRGLSPREVSWVLTLVPLSALLAPAGWGLIADALEAQSGVLRLATAGAGLAILTLFPARGFWAISAAVALFCLFRAPLTALADALAHAAIGAPRERFGRVRVWGSVGFALSAAAVGALGGAKRPLFFFGLNAALYLLAAPLVPKPRVTPASPAPVDPDGQPVQAAVVAVQPAVVPASPGPLATVGSALRSRSIGRQALAVIRTGGLPLLLLGTFCYYAAHSTYDVYYSVHLRALGYDTDFIGFAWALGVLAEILVMLFAPRLLRKPGVGGRWLVLCALAAALRWSLIAQAEAPAALLATQLLHGLTFGLWYLALVKLVQDRSPEALRASVQGIAMTAVGLGQCVGYLGGGPLLAWGGGRAVFRAAAGAALLSALLYAAGFFLPKPPRAR